MYTLCPLQHNALQRLGLPCSFSMCSESWSPPGSIFDRGPQVAGKYNQALSDRLPISWNMSTAFHPQTDGQTERMNRTVEDMLTHFVAPTTTKCDELLVHSQFAINNASQESVQNAPFYLNHGRHSRPPLSASLERGRTLPSKSKILLLLLLHSTCKPQVHVLKHACSMHSKGRSITMTKGMSHLSLRFVQKCSWPPLPCI